MGRDVAANAGSKRYGSWRMALNHRPALELGWLVGLLGVWGLGGSALAQTSQPESSPADAAPAVAPELAIRPPELLHLEQPEYPPGAEAQKLEATVALELDVDRDGKVVRVQVLEPAGHGFDEAASMAARRLLFKPALRDNEPVPVRILFKYEFRLDEDTEAAAAAARFVGRVTLAGTQQPLAGARLTLSRGGVPVYAVTSGAEGEFVVEGITPGEYDVRVSSEGYEPTGQRVVLKAGLEASVELALDPAIGETGLEIVVQGDRAPRDVTYRKLERRELSRVAGTRGDALAALENLPGVARPPALSGLLIVRGTSVESTQIFVDGTYVPNMYHFGGLSSVIPTEMLDHVDFYTGNYSTRYGRGTGGIVNIAVRRARDDGRYHGLFQADLIDARAMLEGPVPASDDWRFMGGVRRSHVDLWLIPLLDSQDTSFETAPVYYDYQAFLETNPSSDSYLRFGIFGSDDRLRVKNTDSAASGRFDQANAFWNVQVLHEAQLSEQVSSETIASFGYFLERVSFSTISADTRAYPLELRSELSFELSDDLKLHFGPDLLYAPLSVDLAVPEEPGPNLPDPGNILFRPQRIIQDGSAYFRPGLFAELEWKATDRLHLIPGLRLDYTHATDTADVSPRLNAKYGLVQGRRPTTLKGGVGFFYEPPQVRETLDGYGSEGLRSIRALQSSLGVEQQLTDQVSVTLEGFHIDLDGEVTRRPDDEGRLEYQNMASGYVIGSELLLRYDPDEDFFGWLSYTLSRSRRTWGPDDPEVFFDFDQTHILAAVGSYQLGRGWELGSRFRWVTGNPMTPCVAGLLSSSENNYLCVSGAFQSERAHDFYQLDLRIEKRWKFSEFASLTAYLEFLNATGREGRDFRVYNFDYSQSDFVSGNIPPIPNLGVRGEF